MKKFAWAAGFGLCLAAGVAFAQDTGSMSGPQGSMSQQSQGQTPSGSMSHDSMSGGSMSQQSSGAMGNQGMAAGTMKKSHTKKKPDNSMSGQSGTMNGPSPEH